ncbi:MAG: selenocysteine-specific translation elongation factor [Ignavibacteria bacterium]|nr:selenocysteine-specific translation elongation factor [Ignavibacteria bacterium]
MEARKTNNHFIMGTAGHVDHGKTALIKALTGIDCDTHPEEQLRGITINLGFAHIDFPNGISIGIVDVPGHRDFINTMISGACGIDFVMLVIAADSSVMPQTVEHLHIMQMLGIKSGIIALTKTDLADEEMLMIVEEDIKELVRDTFLDGCPIFKVSSKNGEGIDELKAFLSQIDLASFDRDKKDFFRMFIDRIFSVAGFGTIVTGSVMSGSLRINDKVFLLPAEKELRIRRLEKHGKEVQEVAAGNRAAINLIGLKKEEFNRGMVLCDRVISSTNLLDTKIKIILSGKKFDLWSQVIFLSGTFESQARIHLIDADNLKCGESALAQIHLNQAFIGQIGDKFIIRNSSGDKTIGGGEIIDPYPLHHKRRTEKIITQLKNISDGGLYQHVGAEVRKTNSPVTLECIANNLNLSEKDIAGFSPELLPSDVIHFESEGSTYLILSVQLAKLKSRIIKILENYHKHNPLDEEGRTFEELMGIFGVNRNSAADGIMKCLLQEMVERKILRKVNATWCMYSHLVSLTEVDKKQIKFVESFHKNCGMNVPLMSELIPAALKKGISETRLNQVLVLLSKRERLYSIDGNYIFKNIVDDCRKILLESLINLNSGNGDSIGITVAQFRDLVNGNRKICLLLLAQFDREGITRREDDLRFLTDKGKDWYFQRYKIDINKEKNILINTGYLEMQNRKKILMIDDDVNLVNVIKLVLEAKNFEFAAAYSAAEGLSKITEFNPDLIILDVIMEDFVAGFRVVSELRTGGPSSKYAAYSAIPILMLTSVTAKTNVDFSDKVGTALLPVDAFIEKPVKPAELLVKIEELLVNQTGKK